jgi:hypothetical protein
VVIGSQAAQKTFKVVVRMQHTPITFAKAAKTPNKAAHARHFCFTVVAVRSRLNSGS